MPSAHRAFPFVPDYGGQVLSSMTLVSIVASNDELATDLQTFGEALIDSAWWPTVGRDYGVGPVAGHVELVGPAITANMDADSVATYIHDLIVDGGPQPNGQTLYLLYLPDGITLTDVAPPTCAYHLPYPSYAQTIGDGYGAVTRCNGGVGQPVTVADITSVAGHEVIEAASDPTGSAFTWGYTPPAPWDTTVWSSAAGSSDYEVADACEGTIWWEDGGEGTYLYQRIWSNTAVDAGGDPCVPALSVPYYNVSFTKDWYAVTPGKSLEIPLTGWSTAPMDNWLVSAGTVSVSGGFQSLGNGGLIVRALGPEASCSGYFYGINDGIAGTLEIPSLSSLAPGDFAVIEVDSFVVDSSCQTPPGQDYYHLNFVGVFVPPADGGVCGLYNFTTMCPMLQGYCPASSSCASNNNCQCDLGYTDLSCSGEPCELLSGGCQYPDWWCAPRVPGSCGPQNFTVRCPNGHGGSFYCPTNATCTTNDTCQCAEGFSPMDCSGQACAGQCAYPNWWCD